MEALPLRLRTLCPNSSFRKGDIPLLLIHPIGVGLSRHFGIGSAAMVRQIALIRFTIQTYWAVVRVTCRM